MKPSPQRNWHPESAPRRRAGIWEEDHEDDAIKMGMRLSMRWDTIFWDLFHQQGQQGEPGCRHLLQPGGDQISSEVTTLWEKKTQKVKKHLSWPLLLLCLPANPRLVLFCPISQQCSSLPFCFSPSSTSTATTSTWYLNNVPPGHQRAVQNLSNVHLYLGSAHQRAVLMFKKHSVPTRHFVLRRNNRHTQCSKKSNLSPRYLYLSWEAI